MKKNHGFTLIELVIVIIVLGILSAVAIPKFINLETDAKNAALHGMEGALNDAIEMSYEKFAIDGKETTWMTKDTDAGKVIEGCNTCTFYYGYPSPFIETLSVLIDRINLKNDGDFVITNNTPSGTSTSYVYITLPENMDSAGDIIDKSCYIKYEQSAASALVAKPKLEFKACK